jgi:hypothetical protein
MTEIAFTGITEAHLREARTMGRIARDLIAAQREEARRVIGSAASAINEAEQFTRVSHRKIRTPRKIVRRSLIAVILVGLAISVLHAAGLVVTYDSPRNAGVSVGTERNHLGLEIKGQRGITICYQGHSIIGSCG